MNNKVLIAAHRGTFGGNIIQNTITAYENAIKHGADIIEIDVTKTIDGQFVAFHTGEEPFLLGTHIPLTSMTLEQVKNLSLYNNIGQLTDQKLNLLDDILEHFRNRCFINIDRSWQYWSNIINVIKNHNMSEQVILKSPFSNVLSEKAEDNGVMYMPIVDNINVLELVLSSNLKVLFYGAMRLILMIKQFYPENTMTLFQSLKVLTKDGDGLLKKVSILSKPIGQHY